MKLNAHEYSVSYLSVILPEELRSDENVEKLQDYSNDKFSRLKSGIEIKRDDLAELDKNIYSDVTVPLLAFTSHLLKNWSKVDTFIITD